MPSLPGGTGCERRRSDRKIVPKMTRQSFWNSPNALQDEGFVTVSGAGPSSRWILRGPAAVRRHLETLWERRRPARYDMSFLESYIPNETFYLGDEVREALRDTGTPAEGRPGVTDQWHSFKHIRRQWAPAFLPQGSHKLYLNLS